MVHRVQRHWLALLAVTVFLAPVGNHGTQPCFLLHRGLQLNPRTGACPLEGPAYAAKQTRGLFGRQRRQMTALRVADPSDVAAYEEIAIEMPRRVSRKIIRDTPLLPEPPEWLKQIFEAWPIVLFVVVVVTLYLVANPVNDIPPEGQMPSLSEWLQSKKARNSRPPYREYSGKSDTPKSIEDIKLNPVSSIPELWEAYRFSSGQLVMEVPSMMVERNFIYATLLQVASFPTVYQNWDKYESCAVEEVALGPSKTALGPLDEDVRRTYVPDDSEKAVVLECGQMVEDYGLSLMAKDGDELAGAATLRVKRLPDECHIDYDDDGDSKVVCNVDFEAVQSASALDAVGYLEAIAVSPAWRGTGLALRLLRFVEDKSRAWGLGILSLHVHRDNWSALCFYQKHGFEITSDWLGWGPGFFLLIKVL